MEEIEELDVLFDHIITQIVDPDCPPVKNPFDPAEVSIKPPHFRKFIPAEIIIETPVFEEYDLPAEPEKAAEPAAAEPVEKAPAAEDNDKPEKPEAPVKAQAAEAQADEAPAEVRPAAPEEPAKSESVGKNTFYTINVAVSDDKLTASISVSGAGGSYAYEELIQALTENGINTGIDDAALRRMSESTPFDESVTVARGTPAKDGNDGSFELVAKAGEDIRKNEIICLLIPAEEGKDGIDVYGNVIHAKKGKAPDVPQGNNTCLNEDHSALIAAADGHLIKEEDVFVVKDEIVINGDLKRPNDRIEASGDVSVYGNVNEGAVINAAGNVYIKGSVTGGEIHAKQITVDFTVRHSTLESHSNMKLANCYESNVTCEGNLQASLLSDCKVVCAGEIKCISGQGVISGGVIRSIGSVICQIMGSNMNEPIQVFLGDCSRFLEEKARLLEKIGVIDADIKKLDAHVAYLKKRKAEGGKIPKEDEDFINASMRIKLQKMMKKEPFANRLAYVDSIISNTDNVALKVTNTLYSNVTITIKKHTATTDIRHGKVTVYESDTGLIYAV